MLYSIKELNLIRVDSSVGVDRVPVHAALHMFLDLGPYVVGEALNFVRP